MATATKTAIVTRTVTIFSHDPDGDARRIMRLARKGAREAIVTESHPRQGDRVVVARVKADSEAEVFVLKLQKRGELLACVGEAIRDGRAYLDTAWGRLRVLSYNDRTGDCLTGKPGDPWSHRTFMTLPDHIIVEGAAQAVAAAAV